MTAPPAPNATPSPTSGRNQDDAAQAAWKARKDRRNRQARRDAADEFAAAQSMPRRRKLYATDTRIGSKRNWPLVSS